MAILTFDELDRKKREGKLRRFGPGVPRNILIRNQTRLKPKDLRHRQKRRMPDFDWL